MRIWLINPPYERQVFREGRCEQHVGLFQTTYPPLFLAYCASILRKKHETRIIDCIGGGTSLRQLLRIVEDGRPDMVIAQVSTPTIRSDLEVIRQLQKFGILCYIFGVHATVYSKELDTMGIRVIKGLPFQFCMNLINASQSKAELENLPFPSWDLVNLENYSLPLLRERFAILAPRIGCPYQCRFCTNSVFTPQERSIDSVLSELRWLTKKGIYNVIFFCELFTTDTSWVRRLCRRIRKQQINIRFMCNTRVDTIDHDLLRDMRRAGLWLLSIGIESGSRKVLKKNGKDIEPRQAREIVDYADRQGIMTLGHFILGLEGENQETLKATLQFIDSMALDFAMFYIATPLPGSKLFEHSDISKEPHQAVRWDKVHYFHQSSRAKLNLQREYRRFLIRFYIGPSAIKRFFRIRRKLKASRISIKYFKEFSRFFKHLLRSLH